MPRLLGFAASAITFCAVVFGISGFNEGSPEEGYRVFGVHSTGTSSRFSSRASTDAVEDNIWKRKWKMETLQGDKHGLTAMSVSPMCFEAGVGWVWSKEYPAPRFVVKTENKRWFKPQAHITPDNTSRLVVTWERNASKIPLYASSDTLSLLNVGQLYHFMWPFMSSLSAAEFVNVLAKKGTNTTDPSLNLRASDDYFSTYSGCPTADDWRQYNYFGKSWRTLALNTLQNGCIGNLSKDIQDQHTRLALLNGLTGHDSFENEMTSLQVEPGTRRIHCFERGVVGAVDQRYLANRYHAAGALFTGRIRCKTMKCKYSKMYLEYPDFHSQVRRRMHLIMEQIHHVPYPLPHTDAIEFAGAKLPCKEITIINRRGSRAFHNIADLIKNGQGDFHTQVVYFEEMTALEQYRTIMASHMMFAVHGSALSWCLIAPSRSVWVEVVPEGSGRTQMFVVPTVFAVDMVALPKVPKLGKFKKHSSGLEGYGVLVRYAASHHFSWSATCPGCTICPSRNKTITTRADVIESLGVWKDCNVTLPTPIFTGMLQQGIKVRESYRLCSQGCKVEIDLSHWNASTT